MTTLTDKMEGLRVPEKEITRDPELGFPISQQDFIAEGINQALDKCIALVKAEAAVVGDWEVNFEKQFASGGFSGVMPQHRDGGQILKRDLKGFITTLLAAKDIEKEHAILNTIHLSDKLESDCNNDKLGDKGMEQWKAFKGFRNTIRDRHLPDRPLNYERD